MVNEFAKYARLQRKYNNLESILKDNSKFLYFIVNVSIEKYCVCVYVY